MPKRHKIIPASYLVLLREGKILLLRRANTGFEDGNYSLIAGHVGPNESFMSAIIREAKEEAGIIVSENDLELVHVVSRKSTINSEERVDLYFKAKKWDGEIKNLEPKKCDDLSWFDFNKLLSNVIEPVKLAIESIKKINTYSEHGWD